MAPRRPVSRRTSSGRARSEIITSTTPSEKDGDKRSLSLRGGEAETQPSQPRSKTMKRTQRHDAFVSRIAKRAGPLKAAKKRRRPTPQSQNSQQILATTLAGLADALPDPEDTSEARTSTRSADAIELAGPRGPVRVRNTSLRSRAGAQKKRAALESLERDWFQRNLASMAMTAPRKEEELASSAPQTIQSPWQALKEHIAGTLQKTKQTEA